MTVDIDFETRPDGDDGHYTMKVPYGWEGAPGVPYGGWTVAVALRAAGFESEKARPASVSAQFLRRLSLDEPLDLDVEVVRRGRRTETIEVRIAQSGKVGVLAVVTGTEHAEGPEYGPEARPTPLDRSELIPLGDFIRNEEGHELPPGHHIEHYDYLVPADGERTGVLSADGKRALTGWIRYGDGVAYDDPWIEAARYCVPADTQVPAAFLRAGTLGKRPMPGDPDRPFVGTTLDLLLHFHVTERSSDWLWYETHVQVAHDGLASGTCNLWGDDGTLLATSMSQVAFLPLPPA